MIGDILRAEREKRGLTIKDIEQETSIRSLYIEAIEKGDYKALPGAVYARGFVRNYAQMLQLNADEIVQQFRAESEVKSEVVEDKPEKKEERYKPVLPRRGKSLFSSGEDFHERVEKSHRTQNIIVAVAVVVIGFVGAIFYFFGEDDAAKQKVANAPAQTTQTEQKNSARTPAPQTSSAQTNNSAAQQTPAPAAPVSGEVSVAAQFSKSCWTQVVADGKTIFEGTIEAGQSFNWQGNKSVTVLAGNAGAVRIAYNGKDIGSLGKEGEVVEKRFTKDKAEDVK